MLTLDQPENVRTAAEHWRHANFPTLNWPRITIVTPSLNQGVFLEQCITSVLEQGYPNLEYFVMDGGSADNSVSVIRKYEAGLAYWQSHPDGGQYQAVQDGLNRGTGDIMAWLNADDVYRGFCLFKVAMLFMAYHQVQWLTGIPTVADALGNVTHTDSDIVWSRARMLNLKESLENAFIGQDSLFWRSTLWQQAGSCFDSSYKLAADYELWLRFVKLTPLYPVADYFSSFRCHGQQKSLNSKRTYYEEMLQIAEKEILTLELQTEHFWRQAPQLLTPVYRNVLPVETASYRHSVGEGLAFVDNTGPSRNDLYQMVRDVKQLLNRHINEYDYFQQDDAEPFAPVYLNLNSIECVSFDFFDTLVYRLCDEPTRLFVEVGRRLKFRQMLPAHISEQEFRAIRSKAEIHARHRHYQQTKNTECSIEQIYAAMSFLFHDPLKALEVEIETEQDLCYLNPSIQSLMIYLKDRGKKIAVISDNYLSSAQLASILQHNNFDISLLDLLISSRDVGMSKADSKLFLIALRRMRINPRAWVHIGDNEHADVKVAKSIGIHGRFYYRNLRDTNNIIQREEALRTGEHNVGSMNSFRIAARRMGRMLPEAWRPFYQYGAFLHGPPLARYADWCVTQCAREGITRVLFFMREAQVLLPLVKASAQAQGVHLEMYPLFVSRHSVNLAGLLEVTPESLFEKTGKRKAPTPRALLKTLGFVPEEIGEIPPEIVDQPKRARHIVYPAGPSACLCAGA